MFGSAPAHVGSVTFADPTLGDGLPPAHPPSPRGGAGGDGMDEENSRNSLLSFNFTGGMTPSWLRGSAGSVFAELPSLGFSNSQTGPLLTPSMGAYLETMISPPQSEVAPGHAVTPGPTPSPAEAAALEQWARIAGEPFAAATVANPEARRFAVRLADSIVRILGDRRHEEPIGDLGAHGHALIERAPQWSPDRVEAVHALVDRLERASAREFGLFLLLVQDLERASRPAAAKATASPGGLWRQFCSAAAGAYAGPPPPRPAAEAGRSNAARFFQTFLRNVRRAAGPAPLAFSGYFVAEYDPATLDLALARASMAAAAKALLGAPPAPSARGTIDWADPQEAYAAHFDPGYCSRAPPAERAVLETPFGLAAALLQHNALDGLAPTPAWAGEVKRIYDTARQSGLCFASWLTPFDLHVTSEVTMRCQQCFARDPHVRATAFAVTVFFVPREASTPPRAA